MDTTYSDFQSLTSKNDKDTLKEIQLTIIRNNLLHFSRVFRRLFVNN